MSDALTLQPRIIDELETDAPSSANKALPKVLLLSSVPPNTNYTGALMLHQMFKSVPKDTLSCFALMTKHLDPAIHPDWAEISYKHRHKPSETKGRHFAGKIGGIESLIKEQYTRFRTTPQIADEIIDFAKQTGVEKIWCTIEGQTLIRVAEIVQKKSGLPMVAQVWDPPGWWLRDNHVDFFSQQEIFKTYGRVLGNAETVAAASWAMAEEYNKLHGANAIPVVPGLPKEWAKEPARCLRNDETLKIGFAGQMYSTGEWDTLILTLESMDWKVEGRPVEIVVLGRSAQFSATKGSNIRYLGWQSQQDSISILSDCDILYCPYWFDHKFQTEARLSFPSKLTTFLAAGRPVIVHAPEYASPFRFLKQHQAGELCHAKTRSAVLNALRRLVIDKDRYAELCENGSRAFRTYLTSDHMEASFLRALRGTT